MKHFVTSNFNLMHSNKEWFFKRKNQHLYIDQNFNYFYFAIRDRKNLEKFDSFHILIHLESDNLTETVKKITSLKNEFKNNYDKFYFLYLFKKIQKDSTHKNLT